MENRTENVAVCSGKGRYIMRGTIVKVFCGLFIIAGIGLTVWGGLDIFKPEVSAGILVESEWTLGEDEAMGTVGFTSEPAPETDAVAEETAIKETEREAYDFGASSVVAPASDGEIVSGSETQTENGEGV